MKKLSELHDEWRQYLSNSDIKVMMDNDGWWFTWKEGKEPEGWDEDSDEAWFSGGEGPYGSDLLEFMLNEAGILMEGV